MVIPVIVDVDAVWIGELPACVPEPGKGLLYLKIPETLRKLIPPLLDLSPCLQGPTALTVSDQKKILQDQICIFGILD